MMKFTYLNCISFFVIIMLIFMPPVFTKGQKDSADIHIKPVPITTNNVKDVKAQWRSILPIQKIILDIQEKQIAANQDTILMLKRRSRIIKIKYVKIYKTITIPLYVPVIDSTIYMTAIRDTVNDYFLDTIVKRKGSFFNRLIHKK